jgi:hypothetical protein
MPAGLARTKRLGFIVKAGLPVAALAERFTDRLIFIEFNI